LEKFVNGQKKIKDAVVYGWGRQIFPKSPKENKNPSNMSSAHLFNKIDASVLSLFTQEFSLVVWLHVRPENKSNKNWSVPIFLCLSDRPKKNICSSATPQLLINNYNFNGCLAHVRLIQSG